MILTFHPIRSDQALVLERQGKTLIVNGEAFDFADLRDGDTLPADAINSPWFCGPASRQNGQIEVTLLLPLPANAPELARYPAPQSVIENGPIAVPGQKLNGTP